MKHYGDITQLHGYDLPVVDVITGGSPCQDLSVAGKREGLSGERSGLFMEQVRIVKEMREHDKCTGRSDEFIRPRYMVWENVPGTFNSNKGADFQAVLTEIVRIIEQDAPDVPMPDKWPHSGCLYSDVGRWSIAWRLHDAQFWGVPQRRKRLCLVADFGGLTAPEILFERKGMHWHSEQGGETRKGTSGGSPKSPGETSGNCLSLCKAQRFTQVTQNKTHCLESSDYKEPPAIMQINKIYPIEGNGARPSHKGSGYSEKNVSFTLNSVEQHAIAGTLDASYYKGPRERNGIEHDVVLQPNTLYEMQHASDVIRESVGVAPTLQSRMGTGGNNVPLVESSFSLQRFGEYKESDQASALKMRDYKDATDLITWWDGSDTAGTLTARNAGGAQRMPDKENFGAVTSINYVRRLTPLECERLQGYPDGWTDIGEWTDSKGKVHKPADSPRYKAIGNSIALPFWQFLARRICAQYERDITMGSLFDGIGGFPYVFKRCGAFPVWASEIDEFCIAVTKKHFPEDDEEDRSD